MRTIVNPDFVIGDKEGFVAMSAADKTDHLASELLLLTPSDARALGCKLHEWADKCEGGKQMTDDHKQPEDVVPIPKRCPKCGLGPFWTMDDEEATCVQCQFKFLPSQPATEAKEVGKWGALEALVQDYRMTSLEAHWMACGIALVQAARAEAAARSPIKESVPGLISACCGATVTVKTDNLTSYYVCQNCNKPTYSALDSRHRAEAQAHSAENQRLREALKDEQKWLHGMMLDQEAIVGNWREAQFFRDRWYKLDEALRPTNKTQG